MLSQVSRIPGLIRKFWAKRCGLYASVYGNCCLGPENPLLHTMITPGTVVWCKDLPGIGIDFRELQVVLANIFESKEWWACTLALACKWLGSIRCTWLSHCRRLWMSSVEMLGISCVIGVHSPSTICSNTQMFDALHFKCQFVLLPNSRNIFILCPLCNSRKYLPVYLPHGRDFF